MPDWLKNAVFYEIYPQTFLDTNGDGIGDLKGIIEKLDYVRKLGCNALWLNPLFDSPFKDAGYDVRDYKKVAPRYGTNEDLIELFSEAHKRGIHVLLDLVPGHTSEEHPWFLKSGEDVPNEYSGRYIWTDQAFKGIAGHPYISGEFDRSGCYMLNFFKCQPALNYGWANPTESWQSPVDAPECLATREAMKDVMRFWLDAGCDGFRVDMADSLVKEDDERKSQTCRIWQNIREMLDHEYPEAAIISEWSNPELALGQAGFHADFYLDHWYNGYNTLLRDHESGGEDRSFFRKDTRGDILRFLDDYLPKWEKTRDKGYISFITCNHDTPRCGGRLTQDEMKIAWAFLLTLPGVPFVYYGDEIGMRYLADIRTKEGGYQRTGSRTPMQWDRTGNYGFSTAAPKDLYTPTDPAADAPVVDEQMADPDSLWHVVQEVLRLRAATCDLQADGPFEVIYAEKEKLPFVYRRGSVVMAVNPSGHVHIVELEENAADRLFAIGEAEWQSGKICMGPQSFAMWTVKD